MQGVTEQYLPAPVKEGITVLDGREYTYRSYPEPPSVFPWDGIRDCVPRCLPGPSVLCTPPPGSDFYFIQSFYGKVERKEVLPRLEKKFPSSILSSELYAKTNRFALIKPREGETLLIVAMGYHEHSDILFMDGINNFVT